MPPKAEKKPAEKSTAVAGKAPAKAAKGVKKVGGGRKKARKQTYSTYIYKGKVPFLSIFWYFDLPESTQHLVPVNK